MNKAKYKRQKWTNSSDQDSELSYEKSERQDAKKEVKKGLVEMIDQMMDYEESKGDVPDGSQ